MGQIHSHCSYCGSAYHPEEPWPRACTFCGAITWRNPIPVVVILARVAEGVMGVRRGIQPGKGKKALPGGYVDHGETIEVAAAREWFEEVGERAQPEMFRLHSVTSSSDRSKLLVFVRMDGTLPELPAFTPNEEVMELVVLRGNEELAFAAHTAALRAFLAHE